MRNHRILSSVLHLCVLSVFSQCSFRGLCLGVFLHSKLTDLIGQKNCADLCRFSARFTSWRSHRGLANCVHIPAWFEDVWTGTYSVYRCLQERLPGKMTCPHTKYKKIWKHTWKAREKTSEAGQLWGWPAIRGPCRYSPGQDRAQQICQISVPMSLICLSSRYHELRWTAMTMTRTKQRNGTGSSRLLCNIM